MSVKPILPISWKIWAYICCLPYVAIEKCWFRAPGRQAVILGYITHMSRGVHGS